MKKTLRTKLITSVASGLMLGGQVNAQYRGAGDFEAGIGYMENDQRAFGFLKANLITYQDAANAHKLGLEYIGYDETVNSALGTDILYTTLVVNYEFEHYIHPRFTVFVGGGGGGQFAQLDSPVGSLDDDIAGFAQVFAGIRGHLTPHLDVRLGVRRLFFDDFEFLGVSGIRQDQTWAFDLGFTLKF